MSRFEAGWIYTKKIYKTITPTAYEVLVALSEETKIPMNRILDIAIKDLAIRFVEMKRSGKKGLRSWLASGHDRKKQRSTAISELIGKSVDLSDEELEERGHD